MGKTEVMSQHSQRNIKTSNIDSRAYQCIGPMNLLIKIEIHFDQMGLLLEHAWVC